MKYEEFNECVASIKALEAWGRFELAQTEYRRLLANDLEENQHAIVLAGRASCYLCSSEPSSSVQVMADIRIETLDRSVQAVVCNVRAHAYHELGEYNRAIIEAQFAEALAIMAGESDTEILGEALARQGFAEAELGRLQSAAEYLFRAGELPVDDSIRKSIEDYVVNFHLESFRD